jgi:hypothetical protein
VSRREKVEELLKALIEQALIDFDAEPALGDPIVVALGVIWKAAAPAPAAQRIVDPFPDVLVTTNTAVHKNSEIDYDTALDMVAGALLDESGDEGPQAPAERPS